MITTEPIKKKITKGNARKFAFLCHDITKKKKNRTNMSGYYADAEQSALEIRTSFFFFFFLHGSRKL